jgi:hypothetical protein
LVDRQVRTKFEFYQTTVAFFKLTNFVVMKIVKFFTVFFSVLFFASNALACACGCGIFSVGTSALIPNCAGGTAFLQYDYINQSRNWHQDKNAASADNEDKQIKSQVITAGAQYMFNREWGAAIRVPYVSRNTKMAMTDEMGNETLQSSRVNSVGDIRINAIYSGFSSDMSSGITFGLKLPTGQANAKSFDSRDMQIGTGSTDSLLGAYKLGRIGESSKWNWFAQGNWQHALVIRNGYRVGDEISAATGIYYNAGAIAGIKKVAPIFQITGSKRLHDTQRNSDPQNSGYSHAFFAPALEFNFGEFKTYADIEFPLYQNVKGNQLVAKRLYKVILGYNF